MTTLTAGQVATALRQLGWRIRTTGELKQSIKHFQQGWNLGTALKMDGIVGPLTTAALLTSIDRMRKRLPTASAHFSFNEFACKCGGKHSACPRIWVQRVLIVSLEVLRKECYGGGLQIVSGCRCTAHNRAVGGATGSQHLYGAAADIPVTIPRARVVALKQFGGVGYIRASGKVLHVDRRDASGHNATGGTPTRPTTWTY